jgi:hypothetical protein
MSVSPLDTEHELLKELASKRYLLLVPKNAKDLRVQYPFLKEYPELSSGIKSNDLLFVWWFSCVCSPYYDEPEEKKLAKCIDAAYSSQAQREAKTEEFLPSGSGAPKFPESIRMAIRRMESLNLSARMDMMITTRNVVENCKKVLNADTSVMNSDDLDAWTARAPKLWALMENAMKAIERGAYGMTEETTTVDTTIDDGALRDYRQKRMVQ